jgi:hypothetical protein
MDMRVVKYQDIKIMKRDKYCQECDKNLEKICLEFCNKKYIKNINRIKLKDYNSSSIPSFLKNLNIKDFMLNNEIDFIYSNLDSSIDSNCADMLKNNFFCKECNVNFKDAFLTLKIMNLSFLLDYAIENNFNINNYFKNYFRCYETFDNNNLTKLWKGWDYYCKIFI